MKTTNLEISKKLKEIGFKKESLYLWGEYNINENETKFELRLTNKAENLLTADTFYLSYDLETLLEAMPTCIKLKKKLYYLWLGGKGIGYYPEVNSDRYCGGNIVYDMDEPILISFNNDYKKWDESSDESLADMAGRLIIKLHETGLIRFGGENE